MVKCPRCANEVDGLFTVDPMAVESLRSKGLQAPPPQVCETCNNDLNRNKDSGGDSSIMAQERQKEQYRLQLWKSRVQLLKKGRNAMTSKNYSEAAVAYEKYLKILELVFTVKKGERLTPAMFKDSARTGELTALASVYWDLLRIYDSNEKYGERQEVAAKQLAEFVHFTPIFPDIIRKAEIFAKQARNPSRIKMFLRMSAKQAPRCFVATAAFESPLAMEVQILRHWRDHVLRENRLGRAFIVNYYRFSPAVARFLDKHSALKPITRAILRTFVKCID